MGIYKLIDFIESLVFNIGWWIIIIPKTIYIAFIYPHKMSLYVAGQWKLPKENRYANGISPILFFVLSGYIPLYLSAYHWRYLVEIIGGVFEQNWGPETVFLSFIFILIFGPASFSLLIQIWLRKTLNKTTFEYLFSLQCLIFTPTIFLLAIGNLFFLFAYAFGVWGMGNILLPIAAITVFLVAIVWFFIAQTITILQHLPRMRRWKLVGSVASIHASSLGLWFVTIYFWKIILEWILGFDSVLAG